ncbi:MAG: NADH-quinone oxidoreductase subunit C, partial [Sphingomonas sp.]|uniref:NADH-quinone oxidoreductase subunit C n=1 Tax=Sphingomonas sp. TaxID=28214 RepID=UPI002587E6CE
MRRTPALIVGGGPAGASAAIVLAHARAPHLLVERSRETGDTICGGFLSWRTLESLQKLGVEPAALGPARITTVRLIAGERLVETPLRRAAHGVSRRLLDSVLLQRAIDAGAAVERGVAARAIDGLTARLDDGADLVGDALFLASGKHGLRITLKTYVDPSVDTSGIDFDPELEVDSLTDIWPGAEWPEREVYDMFGIRFKNHPDLRRILLWRDFPG